MSFFKTSARYGAVALFAGALGFAASRYLHRADHGAANAAEEIPGPLEGQKAPDITLPDLDHKPRSLSEWRGKWLLVNFWATWCAPCMAEIPVLIAAQTQYAPQGLQVLGIAMDDPEEVKKSIIEKGVNYPTLASDEAVQTAMEQLGNTLGAIPYSVLISPDGVIKTVEMGGIDAAKVKMWVRLFLPPPAQK